MKGTQAEEKSACMASIQCIIIVEIRKLWAYQNLFVCTCAKQKEGNLLFRSENCPCRATIMQKRFNHWIFQAESGCAILVSYFGQQTSFQSNI